MTMRRKPKPVFYGVLAISLLLAAHPVLGENKPPAPGGTLPSFELSVPEGAEARSYLGLSAGGSFTIPQIKARAVIIEIFSMYCPFCQAEAPRVNEFYSLIQKRDDLKGKIKVIGIGAGNTPFEVEFFRKKYEVSFPLFPDQDFTIHKALGEVRTPYFIGVKINGDGSHEVFYSKLRGFKDPSEFLKLMTRLSGVR